MLKKCLTCGGDFPPRTDHHKGRWLTRKYCNRRCYENRSPKIKESCEVCAMQFFRVRSQGRVYPRRFCSIKCRNIGMVGIGSSRFHLGSHIDRDGYSVCVIDGKRGLEHVMIAEKSLGRKLWRKEIVHHINGVKADNRPENLLVCSQSMHRRLHDHMGFLYQSAILRGSERSSVEFLLSGLR